MRSAESAVTPVLRSSTDSDAGINPGQREADRRMLGADGTRYLPVSVPSQTVEPGAATIGRQPALELVDSVKVAVASGH